MGDVELLAQHFLRKLDGGNSPAQLTREALDALRNYHFPGNVRELENALTRATALAANGPVTLDCLPPHIADTNRKQAPSTDEPLLNLATDWPSLDELQRRYLALALGKTGGNRQHTADLLGITRRTIQRLIARYNLNAQNEAENGDGGMDDEIEKVIAVWKSTFRRSRLDDPGRPPEGEPNLRNSQTCGTSTTAIDFPQEDGEG